MQQLQEGLVDFMVSGTAIWGSVAPKLQVFDFPFLWRDWDHVHARRRRPRRPRGGRLSRSGRCACGRSPGATRSASARSSRARATSREPGQLAGLKIRTIQSPIYVKAVELMGASPTPMAFGEVYTSLQTGVIDGYEHDASTTLQQRFYEVAQSHGAHASHRRRARSVRVDRGAGPAAAPTFARRSSRRRSTPPEQQRAMGPREDAAATAQLATRGMTIRDIDGASLPAGRPNGSGITEARALGVAPWLEAIRA